MSTPGTPEDVGLEPVTRPRLYERIVARLLSHIEEAGLQPGDRLPPERDLAVRLGVSRASVSQALVAMEVLGVVSVRHGDGAILTRPTAEHQLIAALRAHHDRLSEVLDARSALEVKIAALAAERRTDSDLEAIDTALEAMGRDITGGGHGVEGDERFHAAVTAAAHSALLARLMGEISDLIRETRLESLLQPGRPRQSLAGHQRIAEAVRAQDPQAAAAAMAEHITLVSDVAPLRS